MISFATVIDAIHYAQLRANLTGVRFAIQDKPHDKLTPFEVVGLDSVVPDLLLETISPCGRCCV